MHPRFTLKTPHSCKTKYGTNAEQSNYLDVFVNTANGLCTVNLCSTWSASVDFFLWATFHYSEAAIIVIFIGWLFKWKVKACANRCCLHGRLTPQPERFSRFIIVRWNIMSVSKSEVQENRGDYLRSLCLEMLSRGTLKAKQWGLPPKLFNFSLLWYDLLAWEKSQNSARGLTYSSSQTMRVNRSFISQKKNGFRSRSRIPYLVRYLHGIWWNNARRFHSDVVDNDRWGEIYFRLGKSERQVGSVHSLLWMCVLLVFVCE